MDIEYKVVSGLAVFAHHLFDTLNIGQYIFLFFFLYIMPYALADILGMLRCRASKYVNR